MFLLDDLVDLPNEHKLAWMNKDWSKVKELADSYKEPAESELFANLNAINYLKTQRTVDDSYSKFLINECLSVHLDAIVSVYNANFGVSTLRDQDHFNYLMLTVPSAKRYTPKNKLQEDTKQIFIIALLMKIYNIDELNAKMYKQILEAKGTLHTVLKSGAGFVTDEFLKSITKNVKLQKELRNLL